MIWTAAYRIALAGNDEDGTRGGFGNGGANETPGNGSKGGKILVQEITFNEGQTFTVTIANMTTVRA